MKTEAHLDAAFGSAEPEHYAWQTEHPYVSECERDLIGKAFLPIGSRVLDVGCGEGATLHHLGAPAGATGMDLFADKIEFARRTLPECRFVVGSAYDLPFENSSFDHVLVRDLVHHLDRPERFVDECARVLSPGGRIDVLEPCRYNPLVLMHALLVPVERGEFRSTLPYLSRLISARFTITERNRLQPMPIHRIVFHPVHGRPGLARNPGVRAAVSACERVAGHLIPRALWAYLHVRATH